MITAHLPSGYVLGRLLPARPGVMAAALIGSVFPDLDLIWFYLIDDRAIHHHHYWVHAPGLWLGLAAPLLPLCYWYARRWLPALAAFFAAILMHICLDGIAGGTMWFWPLTDRLYTMTTVPATQSHWLLSFLFHWTMLLELAVWGAALALWLTPRRQPPSRA